MATSVVIRSVDYFVYTQVGDAPPIHEKFQNWNLAKKAKIPMSCIIVAVCKTKNFGTNQCTPDHNVDCCHYRHHSVKTHHSHTVGTCSLG